MPLQIGGSVGRGGSNDSQDVVAVKTRFVELGFEFFPMNDRVDSGLMMAIRLFQSILTGRNTVGGVDGRIDPDGNTIRFMRASNAPHWRTMPIKGPGFMNHEAAQTNDHHDFGTNWLADTIVGAGATYQNDFRQANPNSALFAINDVSLPMGGDTPQHAGHETGLACDIRLPRKDGKSGGITFKSKTYDRIAARAQILALRTQPLFSRAFFNDPVLIGEGLCAKATGHHNHIHFEVKPPAPATS